MERVERINVVIVNSQQQTGLVSRWNSYTIDIDCGRNYHNYRRFRYIVRNKRIIGQE